MDFTLLLLSIIHFGQDTRGKNKLLEGKGSVGMLLSYSGCQILQFSNQMHETICAERLKNTSPRANKCKLAKRNVFTFTDTVYIILMSSLRLIITSTHSFFSSTRTTQSPEVKKKLQNIRKNRKNQTGTNYVPFIPTEKAPRLTQRNTESLAALLPVNYEIFPLILAPIFSSAKAECKYMLSANMLNPACR